MGQSAEEKRQYKRDYYARNRDKILAERKVWYHENVDNKRQYDKKRRVALRDLNRAYKAKRRGFDASLIAACYDLQQGRCAICQVEIHLDFDGPKKTKASCDHQHSTNEPRGLLCNGCNLGLGIFKDSIALLESAARYLASPPVVEVRGA